MKVCRACGAFLMDGWDRCKICGDDPYRVLGPEPEASTPPRSKRERRPRPTPSSPGGPGGRPLLLAAVAVAIAAAGYLLWYQPSQDDDSAAVATGAVADTTTSTTAAVAAAPVDSTAPAPTTTPAPLIGAPGATRDDFAAAIGGVGAEAFPLPGDAWPCAGRLVVDALGGAQALAGQGLSPADFAGGATAGRLVVPAGAVELVAASLAGCGIDMTDLVVRQLAGTNEATIVGCIAAGLDRPLGNQSLATQLVTGTDAMAPGTAYYDHVLSVAIGCGG